MTAELDAVTANVLASVVEGAPIDPAAVTFLLRRYRTIGGDDLRDALGHALAIALHDGSAAASVAAISARLTMFTEALAFSEDDRLRAAVDELAHDLERARRETTVVEDAMLALETTMRTVSPAMARSVIPPAIDQLEHIVGAAYRPGDGMAHVIHAPAAERGRLGDQVRTASALLTAYEATGRLPYAMLAEELMQTAFRESWDDRDGVFVDRSTADVSKPLALNADATRVLCRLAALHGDDDYRRAAVVRSDAHYDRHASRVLAYLSTAGCASGACAGAYGLALAEWLALH
jgi:uncharacterized protein YyaL (SSP411 family)